MDERLMDLSENQVQSILPLIPQTLEEELRNKLFGRLAKNFTPQQLDRLEEVAKEIFNKKDVTYFD